MKEYVFPKRIVEIKSVDDGKGLLKKQELQIGLAERCVTRFHQGDYVIFDFGKELCGNLRILTYKADKVDIRVRFGESLTECCSDLGGEQNATNDHALRDFTSVLTSYSDETLGNTGFRFVRVDFGGWVEIKSVLAVNHIIKKRAVYEYRGQDEDVRKIFDVAKRTVDLCASCGYVWDGVKRDRLVWVGDMHPEMLAYTTLYGRMKVIERSLNFIKNQTPLPAWMNSIPMYSMWWIIILADYYEKTKAVDFIKEQLSYLVELVVQMDECIGDNGELRYPFYFVDWPTHETPEEIHGVRALNIVAMKKAIALLRGFKLDVAKAENLLQRLLKVKIETNESKQVLALKYWAVGLSKEEEQKLVVGGAKGMSTFMSYYILKAVASFDKSKAIEMLKEYYGAMIQKGATTFWEDFDMAWAENSCRIDEFPQNGQKDIHGDFGAYCYKGFRHSLCHGWSAGIIQFIQENC